VDVKGPSSSPPAETAETRDVRANEMAVALRNGLKMGGSLMITWSVALVVKVRVPAHLGPVRQGHFGFAESFAAMFFAVLGLGIDTYIIKEVAVRPKHASDVVGGVFALRSFLTVLLFVVMGTVLRVSNRPQDIVLAVAVFGLINFAMAVNATLGAVLQASAHVGAPVVANVVAKVVWGAGLLIGLHYNVPLALLALPGLAGELLRTTILLPAAGRAAGLRYRIDVPAVRLALLESVPYFVNSLALGVLGSLGMSVLEFIRVDEREVGWFAAVQNAAYLCMLLSPMLFWVVMPLLARAHSRSEAEGMAVFHRCLDALIITIVPLTVLISAGSDILIHLAFGPRYAPAHVALSILSLVFVLTYTNMMLAQNLIILRRGWSVTVISICAVFVTSGLMLVLVPLGRHFIGEGGECAGAASSIIGSEMCVVLAMLSRFRSFPLDRRNIAVLSKSIGLAAVVLVIDHHLRRLGASRLVVDAALYAGVAFAIGIVRPEDLEQVVRLFRLRVAERRAMSS
jgi:O-antigen/teichoic acid export membrane protein